MWLARWEDNVAVGDHIRHARRQLGLSQQDLASRVGVTRSTIIQWESGATEPSSKKLGLVAHVVGLRLEELLADPPEPVREKTEPEQTVDAPAFERLAQLWVLAVWKRFGDREGTGILRLRCGRHRFGDFGGLPAPSGSPAWSCRFSPA
jgi:transcriptional regulator with XRE-family HTH domain